jgi:hypothetical protein
LEGRILGITGPAKPHSYSYTYFFSIQTFKGAAGEKLAASVS